MRRRSTLDTRTAPAEQHRPAVPNPTLLCSVKSFRVWCESSSGSGRAGGQGSAWGNADLLGGAPFSATSLNVGTGGGIVRHTRDHGHVQSAIEPTVATPVCPRELDRAHLANAIFDAHADDPELGHRLLAEEDRSAGQAGSDQTVWRICHDQQGGPASVSKRGSNGKRPGPPVHDDQVRRDFTAEATNRAWLTDITEHCTAVGMLYLCAFTDVFSNWLVGY